MNGFELKRRRSRFLAVLLILAGACVVILMLLPEPGPHHQGRSVRSWFRRLCALQAGNQSVVEDASIIEVKLAFLEMGTNAVPFLVERAFDFRRDTFLRTNLHRLFLGLPEWAGRGAFEPYAHKNDRATHLLRALHPPATVLMPLLEPHFADTNLLHRRQAMFLLGMAGDGADVVLPILLGALTNRVDPWMSGMALQSLGWLGVRASNALPVVLEHIAAITNTTKARGVDWLAQLGPLAMSAVPRIEPLLTSTNERLRFSTAVALIHIDPAHSNALRVLTDAAHLAAVEEATNFARMGPRATLCNIIVRAPRRPSEPLANLLEPLARAEVATWGPAGASYQATMALERVAPGRAGLLYRARLDRPGAVHAAGGLLRLERTNEVAARMLLDEMQRQHWRDAFPLWFLAEASSSNKVAVDGLESIAAGSLTQPVRGPVADWLEEQVRAHAREALARIRYREARVARGLSEGEWE